MTHLKEDNSKRTNSLEFLVQTIGQTNALFGRPSLGYHHKAAETMAMLLDNMQSGMGTYQKVFEALQVKYGDDFKIEFYKAIK